ncbi:hypothetical protein O6H91_06G130200 [Diphasiastrum complanatum]|uniref:Uncharacterized protein n=2 Tax=Diphasiastrum complanatum TaxID=34168 RepID=A0ACC2DIW5_DIPCM|nr:hypothetical protein O6H91_06G130200 [Diphasiastrum complanatum]KAJ7554194.1 hypothetical protein O6H91_06G130200 [Diphasiastrum complanatum]
MDRRLLPPTPAFSVLLLLSSCLWQQLLLVSPFPSAGWDWIATLDRLDGSEFRQIAWPLVQISANAYRYPKQVAVEGWSVASQVLPLAPLHGGAHAVVYEEQAQAEEGRVHEGGAAAVTGKGKRVVLAFRGTDLSGDEGSIADMCADLILFGEDSRVVPMPTDCSKFSNETLDYFSQALNFTRKVIDAYPDSPLLLTGHSLGATLAILVSAALSDSCLLPVVAFSAGGPKNILSKHLLQLEADKQHKVFVISDEWDEVMRTSWKKQVGTFCYYETNIPVACEVCFWKKPLPPSKRHTSDDVKPFLMPKLFDKPLNSRSTFATSELEHFPQNVLLNSQFSSPINENIACLDCFFRTHYLKHVMGLVAAGTQPVCFHFQSLSAVEILKR